MTQQYTYAISDGIWTFQHLLPRDSGGALCGASATVWTTSIPAGKPFPGVALCEQCKLEREARKADARAAELREKAAGIKTYWLQERTP